VLIAGLLFVGYTFGAPRETAIEEKMGVWIGVITSRWDLARGHYNFIEYGIAVPNYTAAIKKRHNVDVTFDDRGCIVTSYERSYARAYNDVMKRALYARYGVDVVEEAEQEEYKRFKP